jgi:hypothetical protein
MVQNVSTEPKSGLSAREIAARNRDTCGKTLSNVMKTAATARELARDAQD